MESGGLNKIIEVSDAIMIARGDLAIDIGHSEVPKVQLSLIKKCSQLSKSVIDLILPFTVSLISSFIELPCWVAIA